MLVNAMRIRHSAGSSQVAVPGLARKRCLASAAAGLASLAWASLTVASPPSGQEPTPLQPVFAKPVKATLAKMDKPKAAEYPPRERMLGQEGWVILSFVVSPDGTVVDPIVENSSGQPGFERAALKAAAKQRYTPASIDGKPVEQCATHVRYVFSIPDMPRDARPEFGAKFRKTRSLIDGGDLATAQTNIDDLFKTGTWNHYETSRLHLLKYELCKTSKDEACMLNSLERAASEDGSNLEPALYRNVLEATAALDIQLEFYGDALAVIEKRNTVKPRLEPSHPLLEAAAAIRARIAGTDDLVFAGKIGFRSGCDVGAPNWRHQLLRREFSVVPEQGKIDKLEVRCDWRRTTDTVSTEKAWKVPVSWGDCSVFVFGDPDATFELVEYPLQPKATVTN